MTSHGCWTAAPPTAYAIAARYPGPPDPTREDVTAALGAVEAVWALLATRLPPEVRS
jgi:hypothetical protein